MRKIQSRKNIWIGSATVLALVLLAAAGVYYYVEIPAFNFHSMGTWQFVMVGILVLLVLYGQIKDFFF